MSHSMRLSLKIFGMLTKVRRMLRENAKKGWARILAALIVAAVVIGFTPQMGTPVYAVEGDPAMNLGTDVLEQGVNTSDAQIVWYGENS